jgi:protein-L-isoaspartate O-methyltransferase
MAAEGESLKLADPIDWYDANADEAVARYESVPSVETQVWLADVFPTKPSLVLDVGAGSGRDAAWLACTGRRRTVRSNESPRTALAFKR